MSTSLVALLLLSSCGPKKDVAPTVIEGWHTEELWSGSCYYPAPYEDLQLTDRRAARQASLEAMISQWRGERDDGVMIDARVIEDVETTLLGYPDEIEEVSRQNLEYCTQMMGNGAPSSGWSSWLKGLPAVLTEGECTTPLTYTLFDYLDIGSSWQLEVPICAGDEIVITGTESDMYRITDGGSWINADGDLGQPATGADYPCNIEGCFVGQLVGRLVGESGMETIFPVGTRLQWKAPEHGVLSLTVNDITYYDNTWRQQGSIIDHTGIQIGPAEY